MSHLLHPPLLEEIGLASADSVVCGGMSGEKRESPWTLICRGTGSATTVVELVLFRVLQESLTNIHRHSESKKAKIRLCVDAKQVLLKLRMRGKALVPAKTSP